MTGPETWSGAILPGGMVCAVPDPSRPDGICGMPVESEPCGQHAAELTPPQALAARMDGDAARYRAQADLASRVLNVTALNYAAGRSDGALAAASEVTQVLGPKWDELAAERDEAREERRKLMTALNVAFLYLGDDGSTAVREALEATDGQ